MRYAAIILGIIAATFLLPQSAFARGGKQERESNRDRRKPKVEVVTEPVVVVKRRRAPVVEPVVVKRRRAPVVETVVVKPARRKTVVVERAPRPTHHAARHQVRHGNRRPQVAHHRRGHRGPVARSHRHHAYCGFIAGHYEHRARQVVVPGYNRKVYVAAKYVERPGPRGTCLYVMVHPAGWRHVWVPATTVTRTERVWVEGRYTCGH